MSRKSDAIAYDRELLKRRGINLLNLLDPIYPGWYATNCSICGWLRTYKSEQDAQNAAKAHVRKHTEKP